MARTLTVVAISPIELVRTKMQSQKLTYHQLVKTIRVMVRQQGVRSLYMGVLQTVNFHRFTDLFTFFVL